MEGGDGADRTVRLLAEDWRLMASERSSRSRSDHVVSRSMNTEGGEEGTRLPAGLAEVGRMGGGAGSKWYEDGGANGDDFPNGVGVAGGRGNGCDGWCPVVVARRAARKLGDAGRAAPSEALIK